jgi:hypothetical protein
MITPVEISSERIDRVEQGPDALELFVSSILS